MKDKYKNDIFNRLFQNNKQSEIDDLDREQRNYKPMVDNNNIKIDFSDLVDTIKDLENTVLDKQKEDEQNMEINKDHHKVFIERYKKVLGSIMSKKRKASNKSQEEICNNIKISRTYLSDIENGKRDINLSTFLILCKEFDVNASVVLNNIIQKIEIQESREKKVNNQPSFYKNIYIQVGFNKFIKMTAYETEKGKKLILQDEDYVFYKNKYGNKVFFHFDKNERSVVLACPGEKLGIKYNISEEDENLDVALKYI